MVDHFRNLPELEDALNKLGIKTDSLEEELDDDIRVEERFWVGGKPKRLRHFKGDEKSPILERKWYQNGQLKSEYYRNNNRITIANAFFINGNKMVEKNDDFEKYWFDNGQLASKCKEGGKKLKKPKYYDKEGNEMKQLEWSEAGYGCECTPIYRTDDTGEVIK